MDAAADKGVKVVLADNNLDEFNKKTAVAATDNVRAVRPPASTSSRS